MKRLVPLLVAGTCVTALGAALLIPQKRRTRIG